MINTKWSIEQKFYNETKPAPTVFYDMEKHRSRTEYLPWPRQKHVSQIGYELFYTKILDPATGKPYEQRDSKGREIQQSDRLGPVRVKGRIEISNPCNFVVQNFNKESHAVEGKTYQERLERFRNLTFDELFEWKYLKKEEDSNSKDSNNKNPSVYK
jgi:hypothetical protein